MRRTAIGQTVLLLLLLLRCYGLRTAEQRPVATALTRYTQHSMHFTLTVMLSFGCRVISFCSSYRQSGEHNVGSTGTYVLQRELTTTYALQRQ